MRRELATFKPIWDKYRISFSKIENISNSNWPYLQECKKFLSETIIWAESLKDLKFKKAIEKNQLYDMIKMNFEDFVFTIDWDDIEKEVLVFFNKEPETFDLFVSRFYFFLEFFLCYKSLKICPFCNHIELLIFKVDENIIYECSNCFSVYDESLKIATERKGKAVFCDRKTLIKKNILRVL